MRISLSFSLVLCLFSSINVLAHEKTPGEGCPSGVFDEPVDEQISQFLGKLAQIYEVYPANMHPHDYIYSETSLRLIRRTLKDIDRTRFPQANPKFVAELRKNLSNMSYALALEIQSFGSTPTHRQSVIKRAFEAISQDMVEFGMITELSKLHAAMYATKTDFELRQVLGNFDNRLNTLTIRLKEILTEKSQTSSEMREMRAEDYAIVANNLAVIASSLEFYIFTLNRAQKVLGQRDVIQAQFPTEIRQILILLKVNYGITVAKFWQQQLASSLTTTLFKVIDNNKSPSQKGENGENLQSLVYFWIEMIRKDI